jgi:purine-nucleoside phosphorylase
MPYPRLLAGHSSFGTTQADICRLAFKCSPADICENVIVAPFWPVQIFDNLAQTTFLSESNFRQVWTLTVNGKKLTYLRTGVGAPVVTDAVFALSCTPCKNIIFIGAVGALDTSMNLGDVVTPEYSVCGNGACRYITTGNLKENDCFGEKYHPNQDVFERILSATESALQNSAIACHVGKTFSVDSIFAEFAHLDEIKLMGCNSIEMETAALFKASKICGIRAGAVFSVSDNVFTGKSVYTRTQADMDYLANVRENVLPGIILDSFHDLTGQKDLNHE